MSRTKLCDCGHEPTPQPIGSCATGYGRTADGKTACFTCCADMEREVMLLLGRAVLYLASPNVQGGHYSVTDWPGVLRFYVHKVVRRNIGGGFGAQRTDAWFIGPDSYVWHAVNRGDNDIVRCKRTRVQLRPKLAP